MNNHISDGELLRAVDGELSKDEVARINEHLAACWMCRTRLNDFEDTIHRFVRIHISDFSEQATEIDGPRAMLRARIAELEKAESFSWWDTLSLSMKRRAVPALVTVGLIIVVFVSVQRPRGHQIVAKITVTDVLNEAEIGEQAQIHLTKQPVTYQKVRIRLGGKSFNRSIYRDVNNRRDSVSVQSDGQAMSEQDAARELRPIERAFSEAKLDWQAPLSPTRLSGWRSALQTKADRVDQEGSATQISTSTHEGPIAEATVEFRNADYHPVSETLRLRDNHVVEIAELEYKVIELKQLDAAVFAAHPGQSVREKNVGGLALELAVMECLNRVNAFMGDQISIERNHDSVLVHGVVDGKQRRDEIVGALGLLAKDEDLHLDIAVPSGVVRSQANSTRETVEGIEGFQRAPADASLRQFFGKSSADDTATQEQVERFTGEVSLHSHAARAHALALKQIAERFSPEDLAAMTPEQHKHWRDMLQSHALDVLKETRLMGENLEPIFGGNSEDRRPLVSSLKSDAELIDAAAKLSDLTSSNDNAVWHSFAASTQASNVTLVCLPEFWDSLVDAEVLAQEISDSTKYEDTHSKGPFAQSI